MVLRQTRCSPAAAAAAAVVVAAAAAAVAAAAVVAAAAAAAAAAAVAAAAAGARCSRACEWAALTQPLGISELGTRVRAAQHMKAILTRKSANSQRAGGTISLNSTLFANKRT